MIPSPADDALAVALVAPDLNGKLRTRHVPAAQFVSGPTPCFADILFAFDARDQLIPRPAGFEGWWPSWADGFGDLLTRPDLASRRRLGWRERVDVVFADLLHADGTEVDIAPRQVLRRVHSAVRASGVDVRIGTELEFFLDDHLPGSGEPVPSDAYAFAPPSRDRIVLDEVVEALDASGIGVASWYTEGGVRQYEIALCHGDPAEVADSTLLARYCVEELAALHGLRASFRPKPGPGFGSGLHVHVSMHDEHGRNLLTGLGAAPADPLGRQCVAGMLAVLQPATAVLSPTPEAYLRLAPHTAAGTTATWAHDNRSAGVRYLDRGAQARVEVRCAASDAHPHLVVAAVLAGIQHGMSAGTALPAPLRGDVYEHAPVDSALPADLTAAAELLRDDPLLSGALGRPFVNHYAETRLWAARL